VAEEIFDTKPQQTSAFEDTLGNLQSTGTPKHSDTLGVGGSQAIPGDVLHGDNRIGPDDVAAWEDGAVTQGQELKKYGPAINFQNESLAMPRFEDKSQEAAYEDIILHKLANTPSFRIGTFDQWGASHFASASGTLNVWEAYHYDTRGEDWTTPTLNNFSGFAQDGTKYTNGVQDVGPVLAPWASETQSNDRSPRADFPTRAMIVVAQGDVGEVVIFDLDNFDGSASSLIVWMRFKLGNASNFWAIGRISSSVQQATMRNGVLTVATDNNGIENGGIFVFDFKLDGIQDAHHYIRSDNQWRFISAKDLTNRHETGLWTISIGGNPTVRISSERVYRAQSWSEGSTAWVVVTGEDLDPEVIRLEVGVPQQVYPVAGDDLGAIDLNQYFYRNIWIDRDGWLWFSRANKLWRSAGHWRDGRIFAYQPKTSTDFRRMRQQGGIELPSDILWLAVAREHVFCATALGVYAVHRGSLDFYFAYSLPDDGGKGRERTLNVGGKMAGNNPKPYKMWGFDIPESGYLTITSLWDGLNPKTQFAGGGVTIVRLWDDAIVQQLTYPNIGEDGAFFNLPLTA